MTTTPTKSTPQTSTLAQPAHDFWIQCNHTQNAEIDTISAERTTTQTQLASLAKHVPPSFQTEATIGTAAFIAFSKTCSADTEKRMDEWMRNYDSEVGERAEVEDRKSVKRGLEEGERRYQGVRIQLFLAQDKVTQYQAKLKEDAAAIEKGV